MAKDRQRFWWKIDAAVRRVGPGKLEVVTADDSELIAYVSQPSPFHVARIDLQRDAARARARAAPFPPPKRESDDGSRRQETKRDGGPTYNSEETNVAAKSGGETHHLGDGCECTETDHHGDPDYLPPAPEDR